MNKLSVFNKDNCLRLLDTLATFMVKDLPKLREDESNERKVETGGRIGGGFLNAGQVDQNYNSFFEKLLDQMQVSSGVMNEKNICRAFSILNRQLKFKHLTEKDILRSKVRTQFFLDKITEIMQMGHQLDFKSVFWSNQFLTSIGQALKERDIYNSGELVIDMRNYQAQSCFMIEASVDELNAHSIV